MRDLDARASVPSPMGNQLDRMRDGTLDIKISDPYRFDEKAHRTATRLLVWNSVSKLAQRALVLKNTPVGWQDKYRLVREADLIPNMYYDPPIYTTKAGEETAPEEEAREPPPEGFRVVRSPRPVFPKNCDIASYLNISERKLRTTLSRAYQSIEDHPLFDLVMG